MPWATTDRPFGAERNSLYSNSEIGLVVTYVWQGAYDVLLNYYFSIASSVPRLAPHRGSRCEKTLQRCLNPAGYSIRSQTNSAVICRPSAGSVIGPVDSMSLRPSIRV
jgi:hypothetical protein